MKRWNFLSVLGSASVFEPGMERAQRDAPTRASHSSNSQQCTRTADHTKQVVHIADLTAEQVYAECNPIRRANADLAGARTLVAVPMLRTAN